MQPQQPSRRTLLQGLLALLAGILGQRVVAAPATATPPAVPVPSSPVAEPEGDSV